LNNFPTWLERKVLNHLVYQKNSYLFPIPKEGKVSTGSSKRNPRRLKRLFGRKNIPRNFDLVKFGGLLKGITLLLFNGLKNWFLAI